MRRASLDPDQRAGFPTGPNYKNVGGHRRAWRGRDLPAPLWCSFPAARSAWAPTGTIRKKRARSPRAFPHQNLTEDGSERTSPVTAFPANHYGLFDMIGNVWEWTTDWYASKHQADAEKACCIPANPRGGREEESYDPRMPVIRIPRNVVKGGSHLCAPNYCRRYRHAHPVDISMGHIGFRCVVRQPTASEPER